MVTCLVGYAIVKSDFVLDRHSWLITFWGYLPITVPQTRQKPPKKRKVYPFWRSGFVDGANPCRIDTERACAQGRQFPLNLCIMQGELKWMKDTPQPLLDVSFKFCTTSPNFYTSRSLYPLFVLLSAVGKLWHTDWIDRTLSTAPLYNSKQDLPLGGRKRAGVGAFFLRFWYCANSAVNPVRYPRSTDALKLHQKLFFFA